MNDINDKLKLQNAKCKMQNAKCKMQKKILCNKDLVQKDSVQQRFDLKI